jgi:hypothetical protein
VNGQDETTPMPNEFARIGSSSTGMMAETESPAGKLAS